MITLQDVVRAAERLHGVVHRTPAVTSSTLADQVGARVHAKAENLQRVGAFKFRGAYNAIAALPAAERQRGVFTYSSGNHAQAVALSARLQDTRATILMPEDAPPMKLAATEGYGAEVIRYDRYGEDRAALGEQLAEERGMVLIPPYDHEDVMAGQGTVALELVEQTGGLDVLVVPVGGGGLISGCAAVAAAHHIRVVGVEPDERPAARRALEEGHPVELPIVRTIADGQQTPSIGVRPFEVIERHVAGVVGVSDDELVAAMRFAFERLKLVLEPSGASALAAVLAERLSGLAADGSTRVGVVLSGGNIDVERFAELVG
ncbi:MAG: pyridoxal-phosphate dependent enzyme [Nitriliruptorales bacterium]|nr:pyridoxal-phosphate dependent enzyme [Nitriliruptorales bacterium]